MKEEDSEHTFTGLKNNIVSYIDLRLQLLKLEGMEKLGKVSSILVYVLFLFFVSFFGVLFLCIGLGLYIGKLASSTTLGMVLVGAMFVFCLLLAFIFRKRILAKVYGWVLDALLKNEENEKNK